MFLEKKCHIKKHPQESRVILKNWLLKNIHNPYADPKTKKKLSLQTGLSVQQVTYFLCNARKTKWFEKCWLQRNVAEKNVAEKIKPTAPLEPEQQRLYPELNRLEKRTDLLMITY